FVFGEGSWEVIRLSYMLAPFALSLIINMQEYYYTIRSTILFFIANKKIHVFNHNYVSVFFH
ncbi:hypothetical protein, partial [Yersinia enterocolitica]|uniref:hypothetical protein n=1 Tax=Yersinia enterocolitica TaxID=630 RepID=UPI000AA12734